MKIIIILGSKADLEHGKKIQETAEKFGVECKLRIASAHKTPHKVLEIIKEYETDDVVFITAAGRSNALSGMVDAQTARPVIACPVPSDKFSGADVFSSLRMPSGVCPLVVLEPEAAALAALKILALKDKGLEKKLREFQKVKAQEVTEADQGLGRG
jgi:5-(carboxyamino)imidazole ribonucleotide mutase